MRIITADERMAAPHTIKGVIFGPHGVGKTTQITTLPPADVFLVDMEAGDLSIQDFPCASVKVRSWVEARDLAVLIGGANPSRRADQTYSQAHYDHAKGLEGAEAMASFPIYFIDSISQASRLALAWCQGQPQAFSEKTGKADNRGAYGLLGQELMGWFQQLQHAPGKTVWLVGGLDAKVDDFNRTVWSAQIEGSKAALELPGIFDQIISMVVLKADDGTPYRAFVTDTLNPWGYPAKDRSRRLEMIEEPNLGKLMTKIAGPKIKDKALTFNLPQQEED